MNRGPTIVRMPANAGRSASGIKCCCCRCFECINLGYLTSQHGFIKLAEAMLGGLCQSLLIRYGTSEASTVGTAYHSFLTTTSACVLTTSLLIACYVLSKNSQQLIQQSIFECLFNCAACFLYLSASSYMAVIVNMFIPTIASGILASYPIMTVVYYIGVILGILHGVDAYIAYKYQKGYR